MSNKAKISLIACVIVMIIFIIIIGPMDVFTHGFYCDEDNYEQVVLDGLLDSDQLEDGAYEITFIPQKSHMAGLELFLSNPPADNKGTLNLTIKDVGGKVLDTVQVDLSDVSAETWYIVYTHSNLKKGQEYLLVLNTENCEALTGNVLLAYAYSQSTFTVRDKVIISMFMVAVGGFICACFFKDNKVKKIAQAAAFSIFLTSILTWNYMYNSMDNSNSSFEDFQVDSETLVSNVIYADQHGVSYDSNFGLGRYMNLKGLMKSYTDRSYLSDDNWDNGYSKTEAALIIDSNTYSKDVAAVGNYVAFANGEMFRIINIEDDEDNIVIYLNTNEILTYAEYGSIDNAAFYDANVQLLPTGGVSEYRSQYGLQGKVFRYIARSIQSIANLNLLCCIATAIVFVLIVLLIARKYNKVMAGVFFVTFWLSPWVVNFARNLYWVEFTWFLPMAIGLFCSLKIDSRKCRIFSYIAAFIAITVKCLCGYEYISTIMMGLIAFLLVDFIVAVFNKNNEKTRLLFRTIIVIGIAALLGFIVAICIHALLKADGDLIEGIKSILQEDVLRRTIGGNMNEYESKYWGSFNASVWQVFCQYFKFSTEIITGITGNLFPVLCCVPLAIFGVESYKKKLNIELFAMYIVFFLTSISWFCLAKAHSADHPHMNFVLWYFGFVQICFYVIINKIIELYNNRKDEKQ